MKKIIPILILVSYFSVNAQNINPQEDEIYRETEVAIIKIIMDPADKDFLLHDDNVWSSDYLHANFQFINSVLDTVLTDDVGIRLRGNTSRTQPKRSFKIKFKEFEGGKFFGYKKFNLKAENNDPSMVREMLAMQSFRNANVAATRTHHTELYINDEYMGIYLNVEQLDDEFVAARFNNDSGNLYKCTWPATLEDDGQIYDDGFYELKSNEDENDRSVLAHFVDVLNNTSDDNFRTEIETVFNVQPYIRYLAVEALIGHWDGYSYNKNNFYLYENPDNGLIEFMPYDTDNTFGINWLGEDKDWATRDIIDWAIHSEDRPLTKRILAVDSYFRDYINELENVIDANFNEDFLYPQFDDFKNRLSEPISRDNYYLTYRYTFQDFKDSYELNNVAGHLPYGLKPYITERATNAQTSLSVLGVEDKANHFEVYPNPSNGKNLSISSTRITDLSNTTVTNIQGARVSFTLITKGNAEYQILFDKALPSGMYILKLKDTSSKFLVF